MLCYRDTAFCPYHEDCRLARDCHRPLTDEVRRRADQAGLPLSQFAQRPPCWEDKNSERTIESWET